MIFAEIGHSDNVYFRKKSQNSLVIIINIFFFIFLKYDNLGLRIPLTLAEIIRKKLKRIIIYKKTDFLQKFFDIGDLV